MINDFIANQVRAQLPFVPNEQQEVALRLLGGFIADMSMPNRRPCFLLRGYAGTGKSSLVGALTRAMDAMKQRVVLMAPTGRAAKVISAYSGFPAWTIHKRIYRQTKMGEDRYGLAPNMMKNTLFVVDEASMLSDLPTGSNFGSGRLLDDLIKFVYAGDGCALLCLGDVAQLPPVGQSGSPALDDDRMTAYGLDIVSTTLTLVARQALDSGILFNATQLREQLAGQTDDKLDFSRLAASSEQQSQFKALPDFEWKPDFVRLSGNDFLETLERAYSEVGPEETIIVTRTNRRTGLYNESVRARVLWREDEVSNGDRLMVVKNNYFWTENYEGLDFLANGDMLEICRIQHHHEMYGYHFAEMSLRSLDYDWEIDALVWLDSLHYESPEELRKQHEILCQRVTEDYPEIRSKKELWEKIMQNPYYNALQVKFAYCVTCHKAQGGQWKRVFVDPGFVTDEQVNADYYRWYYTALTRATEQIYLLV